MKSLKLLKLRSVFVITFLLFYTLFYYFNVQYKNYHIQEELNSKINELQLHYDITQEHHKRDLESANLIFPKMKIIQDVMSQAYGANKSKKATLRAQLYSYLLPRYQAMRIRGYSHVQFIFPDNNSFLRMHKPTKFGDNLKNTRYSFNYTNTTHQPISGFEKGRTSHAFRNIFPIFDSNGTYLGAYELSFSSDSIQDDLSNVNKIHSHFLVNKTIFDAKMWDRKDKIFNYIQSIENDAYKYTILTQINYKKLAYRERNILKPHKKYISKQMKLSKRFGIYTLLDARVATVSFLPIYNTLGETQAYLVSYSKSEHIANYLYNFIWVNIVIFLLFLVLFILMYKHIIYKKSLEITTQEQKQLLSLFDRGDTTIFKWRNDKNWSVSYSSENVKLLTGYSKKAFESGSIDYISIVNPEDRESVIGTLQHIIDNHINIFKQKSYRINTKNGETKWLLCTSQIINDTKGNTTHLLGYVTDITDIKNKEITLKESEMELEALTENLQKRVNFEVDT